VVFNFCDKFKLGEVSGDIQNELTGAQWNKVEEIVRDLEDSLKLFRRIQKAYKTDPHNMTDVVIDIDLAIGELEDWMEVD
jgi:hypothetical protein